jgi:hypothetical protein
VEGKDFRDETTAGPVYAIRELTWDHLHATISFAFGSRYSWRDAFIVQRSSPPQKFEAIRIESVKKVDPPNGSMVQIVGVAANGKQVILEMTVVTACGMAEQILQLPM